MGKVDNFKTYESNMKTRSFKNLHSWGKTEQHTENELEATGHIIKGLKSKGTPHLDWINSKGYSISVEEGHYRNDELSNLGMDGVDYTFYLIPSWTKESYLPDQYYGGFYEEEATSFLQSIGLDINDLPIYGKSKNHTLYFGIDGGDINAELGEIFHNNTDEDFDPSKVVYKIEERELDYTECPLWGAKVPMRFNRFPSEGSEDFTMLCEYGLVMIRHQIGKLMLATGTKRYEDLERNLGQRSDIIAWEPQLLVNYLNKSDLHVTKNEDIIEASKTSYNLYKGHKLFYENHEVRDFRIPKSLVSQFLKEI